MIHPYHQEATPAPQPPISRIQPRAESDTAAEVRRILAEIAVRDREYSADSEAAGALLYAGFAELVPAWTAEERARRRRLQVCVLRVTEDGLDWNARRGVS